MSRLNRKVLREQLKYEQFNYYNKCKHSHNVLNILICSILRKMHFSLCFCHTFSAHFEWSLFVWPNSVGQQLQTRSPITVYFSLLKLTSSDLRLFSSGKEQPPEIRETFLLVSAPLMFHLLIVVPQALYMWKHNICAVVMLYVLIISCLWNV